MKKLGALILILFFPVISSVTIEMNQEFSQKETLIAKVSGNFYEAINQQDIAFYRGHVRIPMSPFITKINNDFYIYAQLEKPQNNNYSILLKNVKHSSGGEILEEDFRKNFVITNQTADFKIDPGFIVAEERFLIKAENLKDNEITIDFSADSINLETKDLTLFSGEEKKIYFLTDEITSEFQIIKLKSENTEYNIPVYIFGIVNDTEIEITENTTCQDVGECASSCNESYEDLGKLDCSIFSTCCKEVKIESKKDLDFEKNKLEITIPTNSYTLREIYLSNTGEETIKDISLLISGELKNYIDLSLETIDELEPDSKIKIELEIYSFDKDINVEGKLIAKEKDTSTYLEIKLDILRDYTPPEDSEYEYTPSNKLKTCEELNGKICDEDEECSTDYVYAKDAKCCLGECGGETKSSSSGKIIGWSIVGIIAIFLIWFFTTKYRGAKKPVNLLDIAKPKKPPIKKK